MDFLWGILIVAVSYLLGSISFSVILTKVKYKQDVRTQGSGNAGATNVARVFGMKAGLFTLFGDMAKTAIAMGFGSLLMGDVGLALAGAACVIGHCWPVFFNFRGGKGVSVGAALGLMVDWRVILIMVIVFFVVVLLTKIVSAASVSAAIATPIAALIVGVSTPKLLLTLFAGPLVVYMHRSNIKRMLRGEEKKFQPKKKES